MIKKPAVFLDRDGVLCIEKSYVTSIKELDIFPYTRQCIDILHQKGFFAICITNQSAVARGMMTEKTLQKINEYLIKEIDLDALYYCPHHPEGIGKYKLKCNCRKPNTDMIEYAIKKWGIDRDNSYMVGDRASDIICGKDARVKTVLLESGYGIKHLEKLVKPNFIYRDLKEFIEIEL